MEKCKVVRNAVSKDLVSFINEQARSFRDVTYYYHRVNKLDLNHFSDEQSINCFKSYGWPCSESLLEHLRPLVEKTTGKKLFPTYSYFRFYYKDAVLPKHVDRPSCEYSVTLNTYYDPIPWEICFENQDGSEHSLILEPGDIAVYKGCDMPHWRPGGYQGNEMIQIFLHYVDSEGPFKEFKYDCREMLAISSDYRSDKKLLHLHETIGKDVMDKRNKY